MEKLKAPFPYFGGKRFAAPHVWAAIGDPEHYVEPFGGSLANLLQRPTTENRTYYSETVNDIDGLLTNAWRAMQWHPDATAEACSWPVSEIDLTARHLAIVRWRAERDLEKLLGDPRWCDPEIAGWWIWGMCCWVGGGWCSGQGPWVLGPGGRIMRREKPGPGVTSQLPHLASDGRGANHPGSREPGVTSKLPHLSSGGQGANRPGSREPGVTRQIPMLGSGGQGVNRPWSREPGVTRQIPMLVSGGQGVNTAAIRAPGVEELMDSMEPEFHPMTMPEVRRWFQFLSARLRHVRICCGDWKRLLTPSASKTVPVRMGDGVCGVFLDPPYEDCNSEGSDLYAASTKGVAHDVRKWAIEHGDDPDYRIVVASYAGAMDMPKTWTEVEWFTKGFLKGGLGTEASRDRLWLSPHCIKPQGSVLDLF